MLHSILSDFEALLDSPRLIDDLRAGLIGNDVMVDSPFGPHRMLYADYVASGRALMQVETFVLEKILPFYANSHTEASYCGSFCTRTRQAAREYIAQTLGANDDFSVLFTGSGATAGINRLVKLLRLTERVTNGQRIVILVGPYEHHSNLLPWRETGAEIIAIPEAMTGGPDLDALGSHLTNCPEADCLIGAFSAASNVTGIVTDVDAVTRLLNRHGAISIWDYACGAPYLPMDMKAGSDIQKDVVVFSSHKFPGGPGASGITVVRNAIVEASTPSWPGGGTVSYVSPWTHIYSKNLVNREEAGTPNVVGDIRAAMVLMVKQALGISWLQERQQQLRARAIACWSDNPRLDIMGLETPEYALPIFSFRVRDGKGSYVHHQLFTRLLSDVYGIQARGGCACAGAYAHRLLGLDKAEAARLYESISAGHELDKPGWVRLNISALMTDVKADQLIESVDQLTRCVDQYATLYKVDEKTARFSYSPALAAKSSMASMALPPNI